MLCDRLNIGRVLKVSAVIQGEISSRSDQNYYMREPFLKHTALFKQRLGDPAASELDGLLQ